jgi:hypothetical protein
MKAYWGSGSIAPRIIVLHLCTFVHEKGKKKYLRGRCILVFFTFSAPVATSTRVSQKVKGLFKKRARLL